MFVTWSLADWGTHTCIPFLREMREQSFRWIALSFCRLSMSALLESSDKQLAPFFCFHAQNNPLSQIRTTAAYALLIIGDFCPWNADYYIMHVRWCINDADEVKFLAFASWMVSWIFRARYWNWSIYNQPTEQIQHGSINITLHRK